MLKAGLLAAVLDGLVDHPVVDGIPVFGLLDVLGHDGGPGHLAGDARGFGLGQLVDQLVTELGLFLLEHLAGPVTAEPELTDGVEAVGTGGQ